MDATARPRGAQSNSPELPRRRRATMNRRFHSPWRDVAGARTMLAECDDAELVRKVALGDLSPLGVLYDRHHRDVRRFVERAVGSDADAEDMTHEAFLTLVEIASTYDGRPSARPFLFGIA